MVNNPEELAEIDIYRNPDTGRLIGRDPVSGDLFALPVDRLRVASAPSSADEVARQADIAGNPHGAGAHDGTVAELAEDGTLLSNQVPDLAITETFSVADESERLALSVQEGDVAIQQDVSEAYIFTGGDPSVSGNWSKLLYPDPPISSVYGRTGSVQAQSGDYTAEQITGLERRIWVIENGASDPADADPEDLIFEKEA